MIPFNKDLVQQLSEYKGKKIDADISPIQTWLGGTVKDITETEVSFEFEVRKDMLNPIQSMHGGIHALILDEMMGLAVFLLANGKMYVAVNLTVDFLNPVRAGHKVTAVAKVIRAGHKIAHAECIIYNKAKKIVSKASSNFASITSNV